MGSSQNRAKHTEAFSTSTAAGIELDATV